MRGTACSLPVTVDGESGEVGGVPVQVTALATLQDALAACTSSRGVKLARPQGHATAKLTVKMCGRPRVLMIHPRRSMVGKKIGHHVEFPAVLDVSQCAVRPERSAPRDLVGVVVHASATSQSGHQGWCCCDDATVTPVSEAIVMQQQACILFHERSQVQGAPGLCGTPLPGVVARGRIRCPGTARERELVGAARDARDRAMVGIAPQSPPQRPTRTASRLVASQAAAAIAPDLGDLGPGRLVLAAARASGEPPPVRVENRQNPLASGAATASAVDRLDSLQAAARGARGAGRAHQASRAAPEAARWVARRGWPCRQPRPPAHLLEPDRLGRHSWAGPWPSPTGCSRAPPRLPPRSSTHAAGLA